MAARGDRVDDDVGAERAPEMLVAEIDGTVEVLVDAGGGDARFAEDAGERLCGETDLAGGGAVEAGDERDRCGVVAAEQLRIRVRTGEHPLPLLGAGVVRRPSRGR